MKKYLVLFLLLFSVAKSQLVYSTGEIFTKEELTERTKLNGEFGDTFYYRVDSSCLEEFNSIFLETLKLHGLEKWTERYDCNNLVSLFVSSVKARFAAKNLRIETKFQETLAIAEVWYIESSTGTGHAIVAMYSNVGLIYFDPQLKQRVFITDVEKNSIFLVKW